MMVLLWVGVLRLLLKEAFERQKVFILIYTDSKTMKQSRRQLIGLLGVGALSAVAGCTDSSTEGSEPSDSGDDASPAEGNASQTVDIAVVISGPDGERPFFETDDVSMVGSVEEQDQSGYQVPVALSDDGTADATEAFREVGATEAPEDATITHTVEGDVESEETLDVAPSLADAITAEEWDGQFVFMISDRDTATTVKDSLAGD